MWAGFVCMFVCVWLPPSGFLLFFFSSFFFFLFMFLFPICLLTVFTFFNGLFLNTTIKTFKKPAGFVVHGAFLFYFFILEGKEAGFT